MLFLLLAILFSSYQANQSFSILIHVGLSTRSHVSGIFEIANELIARGHRIHYAASTSSLDYAEGFNFTKHELEAVPLDSLAKMFDFLGAIQVYRRDLTPLEYKEDSFEASYFDYKIAFNSIPKILKENSIDLIVCDFNSPGCRDAAELSKLPTIIGLQSTYTWDLFYAPYLSRQYNSGSTSIESMPLLKKIYNVLFKDYEFSKLEKALAFNINRARLEYGLEPKSSPLQPLSRNLLLSTSFTGFEPAFHQLPNLNYVGPIKNSKYPPLSEDIQVFLNSRERIIYAGFGSAPILLPEDYTDIIGGLSILIKKGIIDGVIWGSGQSSYSNDENPDIKFVTRAPQKAILNQPQTKLFFSHCGIESIMESIDASKPVLCNPLCGDQIPNAVKIKEAGIGDYLQRHLSSPELIADLLKAILEDRDESIKGNSTRLKMISDRLSRRGVSDGANLVEDYIYTAKACRPFQTGDFEIPCEVAHLIPASERMSFIQAQLLDVYAFIFIMSLLLLSGVIFILRYTLHTIFPGLPYDKSKKD